MNRIVNCKVEIPDELSPECADFLKKIFVPGPADRPSIQQLRQSAWSVSLSRFGHLLCHRKVVGHQNEYQLAQTLLTSGPYDVSQVCSCTLLYCNVFTDVALQECRLLSFLSQSEVAHALT